MSDRDPHGFREAVRRISRSSVVPFDIDAPRPDDDASETFLELAIKNGFDEFVDALCDLGANVN